MWGQDWGSMIWGGIAVPTMGPLGWTFLLGAIVGASVVLYRKPLSKTKTTLALLAIAIVPLVAIGQAPNTFTNGTVADADEVNANFTSVEGLHDRLAFVEGFAPHSSASTTFVNVTGRTLTYDKQSSSSVLQVTYEDHFEYTFPGTLSICYWRLTVDGVSAGEKLVGSTLAAGSSIVTWSGSFSWLVTGLSAGNHTIQLQVRSGVISACNTGTSVGANESFLLVEEKGL